MIVDLVCIECGKHENRDWVAECAERLIARQLCFTCDHWMKRVDDVHNPAAVRVDHQHWIIAPDSRGGMRGCGGREHNIQFDDGRVVVSHNLWHQGTIPEHFWDRLPDNAQFLRGDDHRLPPETEAQKRGIPCYGLGL